MFKSWDFHVKAPAAVQLMNECDLLLQSEPTTIVALQESAGSLLSIRNRWAAIEQDTLKDHEEIGVQKKIAYTSLRFKSIKDKFEQDNEREDGHVVDSALQWEIGIAHAMLSLANLNRDSLPMNFMKLALEIFKVWKPVSKEHERQDLLQLKLMIQTTKRSLEQLKLNEYDYHHPFIASLLFLVGDKTFKAYWECTRTSPEEDLFRLMVNSIDERCQELAEIETRAEESEESDSSFELMKNLLGDYIMDEEERPYREGQCELCIFQDHKLANCDKYRTLEDKLKRAKQLRLCLKCLKDDHFSRRCSFQPYCNICNEKHRTSICSKAKPNAKGAACRT